MVWGFVAVGEYPYAERPGPSDIAPSLLYDDGRTLYGRYDSIPYATHTLCSSCDLFTEICSAHPTSGGPYFWAAMLSKPSRAPLASWITGWFNLLGQVAVTTGIRYVHLHLHSGVV